MIREFDIPFPKKQKEHLLDLVKFSQTYNVLSVKYLCSIDVNGVYHISYYCDDNNHKNLELQENPAPGFDALGFIKYDSEKKSIFLMPKAFKWAEYEKKTKVVKWWLKTSEKFKDFMLAFAFLVSLAISIMEILKAFNVIP